MTEKIRKLINKVHLAGALAELNDVREGTTKDGVPYLSFSGAVQCGENSVDTVRFRTFVKSKKSDGTDSKNYVNVKKWVNSAVSAVDDPENPTYVDMIGSITDNPYVASDGELREAIQFNCQLFGKFNEYAKEIDLEGFIHSVKDETAGTESDDTTGRQRMRLISRDIFNNTLDIKNIIIPEDLVTAFEDNGYEKGATATFFVELKPNKKVTPVASGGIGAQRAEGGKPYLEWVLQGATPVIDVESENALTPKLMKDAMTERQTHLDEVKAGGYLGNKTSEGTVSGDARNNMGSTNVSDSKKTATKAKKASKELVEDLEEDDFPF